MSAVITFAGGWALLLVALILLVLFTKQAPFGPGHWAVAFALCGGAAGVGLVFARRRWAWGPADISVGELAKWLAAALAATVVMAGCWMWDKTHGERQFMAVFPSAVAADHGDALVSAGYDACDWLQNQPWGQPQGPELSPLTNKREPTDGLPDGYFTYLPNGISEAPPCATATQSTTMLSIQYAKWVDAQFPASQADEQKFRIQASRAAWSHLCPMSQEVRRPFVRGGDSTRYPTGRRHSFSWRGNDELLDCSRAEALWCPTYGHLRLRLAQGR